MFIFVKLSIVDTCRGHDYAFGYPCKIRPLDFVFLANFWNIEKDKWMSSKWIFFRKLRITVINSSQWNVSVGSIFWGSFGIYTKIYVDNKDFKLTLLILSWILFWRLWTNFAYFLESFFPIDHVKARYCRNFFYYKNHFFLVIE